MAPGLLHEMAPLLSPGSGADAALVRRVLSILRSVVGAMQSVTGTHAAGVKALLTEVLAEWAPLLAAVLAPREVGCHPGSGRDLEGLEEWGTGGGIRLRVLHTVEQALKPCIERLWLPTLFLPNPLLSLLLNPDPLPSR